MEKLIKIGNEAVPFKATAGTVVRYMSVFHTDLLKDLQNAGSAVNPTENTDTFMNLAYIMAKQADDSITDLYDFLDRFEYLDFMAALPEVLNLWTSSATSTIKAKKNIVK